MTVRAQLQGMAVLLLLFTLVSLGLRQFVLARVQQDTGLGWDLTMVRSSAVRLANQELAERRDEALVQSLDQKVATAARALNASHDPVYREAGATLERDWADIRRIALAARTDPALRPQLLDRSEALFDFADRLMRRITGAAEASQDRLQWLQWALAGGQLVIVAVLWWVASRISAALGQTVATMASTSRQLTVTVEEHERVAAQQATATSETSTTMEELAASFRLSSEQAEAASAEARQVIGLADKGGEQAEQTGQAMVDLRQRVEEIAGHIVRLSEQVQQIGTIGRLVGDLAAQTNMLALNAAVEAARAGDAGRGFAVVAAEIRKLADESRRSAERVTHLVGDVQNATHTTVLATEAGTRTVERTVVAARETSEVFRRVADSVNSAFDSVQQISLNLRQQSEAVGQVVVAMNSLRNGARDTSAGLTQTRQATATLDEAARTLERMVRGA